jgi:hypothetical protein
VGCDNRFAAWEDSGGRMIEESRFGEEVEESI